MIPQTHNTHIHKVMINKSHIVIMNERQDKIEILDYDDDDDDGDGNEPLYEFDSFVIIIRI